MRDAGFITAEAAAERLKEAQALLYGAQALFCEEHDQGEPLSRLLVGAQNELQKGIAEVEKLVKAAKEAA